MTTNPRTRTPLFGLRSLLLGLLVVVTSGCGGSQASRLGLGELAGEVTERAEGYGSRPDWADANRPWSRQGDGVRVVGYVAIRADQRMEAGYRAADSYARAELVRFLSVRVVSVLEDQMKSGEPDKLRESIEVLSQAWVDDLTVAQRYWEKRKSGSDEKLHIWSRLDVDQTAVAELLQRAAQGATNLTTPAPALVQKLKERWSQFADVSQLNQGDPLLPADVAQPPWAKSGDRVTDAGFEFVCHGLAKDEKTARALAQARCSEKLCRLFGVQITAKSKVTENLDGVTAENEVSEQCANVRVVGRQTRYQGGECGPHGCVQWLQQSYPRAAYEEEKQRLDKPTVIRQEVVIQEAGKLYRDPAACEASLRSYSAVTGQTSSAFEQRRQHLKRAMQVCQEIDGRESGLFLTLNNLLTMPLPNFTVESGRGTSGGPVNTRFAFTIASPEWRRSIDTQRFLTERISSVLTLVNDAVIPLRLIDLADKGGDAAAVDALMREVVKYPFVNRPASQHHQYYLHDLALSLARRKHVAHSTRYRNYLIEQGEKGNISCGDEQSVYGRDVMNYLAADGRLDDREWQVGLRLMRNSATDQADGCFQPMFRNVDHGAARGQRIEQIAQMVLSGEIKSKDRVQMFKELIDDLELSERAPLFFRHRTRLTGAKKSTEALVHLVVKSTFGWQWAWQDKKAEEGRQQCESMPNRIGSLFADIPEAKTTDTGLCLCLRVNGVSPSARKAIVSLLFRYAEERCGDIKPEDWPEPYYSAASPKTIPYSGRSPFAGHIDFLEPELKQCVERHGVTDRPQSVSYMTVTIASGRFSNAKVDTTIVGDLKDMTYRDKRRGFVHASDVLSMKRSFASCIQDAANRFVVPSLYSITKEARPQRLWFQIWDTNLGTSGFVQ